MKSLKHRFQSNALIALLTLLVASGVTGLFGDGGSRALALPPALDSEAKELLGKVIEAFGGPASYRNTCLGVFKPTIRLVTMG